MFTAFLNVLLDERKANIYPNFSMSTFVFHYRGHFVQAVPSKQPDAMDKMFQNVEKRPSHVSQEEEERSGKIQKESPTFTCLVSTDA